MKKYFLPLLAILSLSACASNIETLSSFSNSSFPPIEIKNLNISSERHFTTQQLNYLSNNDFSNTSPYNGNMSVGKPLPVSLTWEANYPGPFVIDLVYRLGDKNYNLSYQMEEANFDFYNPYFNVEYQVKVTATNQNVSAFMAGKFTEIPSFAGPRNLYIDGVENFRDIGGWGRFINDEYFPFMKQGMLYRSGRMNEDKADEVVATISEMGIKEINENLKIKTEIDFRRTSNNEVGALTDCSVLGDHVNYVQLPMAFGGNNILTYRGKLSGDSYQYDNPVMIKNFFDLLADVNNYPINFHCSIGKDRTGCIAYLIEGLLGFEQETMYRDYMFTNFSDAGMCKIIDITDRYGATIDNYQNGASLQEKIYNYLKDEIGVSAENLDRIIDILKV